MKTMTHFTAAILAGLSLTGIMLAAGTDDGTKTSSTHHSMHGPMHGGMYGEFGGGFMMALHKLNLTAEQQANIKDIIKTAHEQMKSPDDNIDFVALNNPGDPNHAQAVRSAQSQAAQHIEHHSNVEQQIYNLMTTEQKTQLPKVLADMKAKFDQHRSQWQEHHAQGSSTSSK